MMDVEEDDPYFDFKSSVSAIPVKALNVSSRLKLAINLDSKQILLSNKGYAKDYRGLAELIGFQHHAIKKFEESQDRTSKILEEWGTRPDATIDKLISYLQDMERDDIITELIPSLKKDVEAYLEFQKSLERPIQVPEVTSGPLNLLTRTDIIPFDDFQNAGPLNWQMKTDIITIHDKQSGESTKYDAYLSYAEEDTEIAGHFSHALEHPAVGLKLFIPDRDMLGGCPELNSNIEMIQNRCRHMLIILTPNLMKSPVLEFQISFASSLAIDQRQRILIPIIWESCEIPPILSTLSKIDFSKRYTHDWMMDKLIISLLPEGINFSPIVARSFIKYPSTSEYSISVENTPAITFPLSSKHILRSTDNSNPVLRSIDNSNPDLRSIDISNPDLRSIDISNPVLRSIDNSNPVPFTAPIDISDDKKNDDSKDSGECSGMKDELVLSPPKPASSPNKLKQLILFFKRKENPTSSSTPFSSDVTSGFHSQSSSSAKNFENSNDYCTDTSL